ncbi:spore germination protein [Tepidibacter formicigenes]|jgi:spore germination protein|uniref:Spore germination protein n=1 Tax=Tepidibacter formicigenes DSM 15518 TaxID=1123349 RepID=A0A1M6SVU9_9FIRM|nr:spore germination protein [Tepidibacter formicigenes]SHK48787.1 spore germination protein [Tepidibacter formicigenes DSM 15518]
MTVIKHDEGLDKKLDKIKTEFKDCDDLVIREIEVGFNKGYKMALVYIDGLTDKALISDFALNNLIVNSRMAEPNEIKTNIKDLIKDKTLAITEIKEIDDIEEAIKNILVGETILFIDGIKEGIMLSSRGWPTRSVSEPQSEVVIRGPRDGFTETLKINTSLVRRRIRDTNFKLKNLSLGKRSKTDVALLYIEDIVNKEVLEEVKKRLDEMDIDAIQESGSIEQLIEDSCYSLFPQIQYTERPDVVSAALYEGRVAILVDNTPFALIVPVTLNTFLQSPDDYYERWIISSLIRLIRIFATAFSLLLPALYIAITSYHPGMLPTELALYLGATRQGVPFPAFTEAFIMEGTLELLREAGVRLPRAIGATIGIVGGLVIGQAAVQAGIVSPLMVIIVAVTAISSFATPSYNMAIGFRMLRFIFMFAASILGLYGIILAFLVILINLSNLRSFGIPYLSPLSSIGENYKDLKDTLVRMPMSSMKFRPKIYTNKDSNRLDDKRKEVFGEDDIKK